MFSGDFQRSPRGDDHAVDSYVVKRRGITAVDSIDLIVWIQMIIQVMSPYLHTPIILLHAGMAISLRIGLSAILPIYLILWSFACFSGLYWLIFRQVRGNEGTTDLARLPQNARAARHKSRFSLTDGKIIVVYGKIKNSYHVSPNLSLAHGRSFYLGLGFAGTIQFIHVGGYLAAYSG